MRRHFFRPEFHAKPGEYTSWIFGSMGNDAAEILRSATSRRQAEDKIAELLRDQLRTMENIKFAGPPCGLPW